MRECTKSGARGKKREGEGVKERKRRESGDYRQPVVKKTVQPLAASVF